MSHPFRFIRTVRHFPARCLLDRLVLRLKRSAYGKMPGLGQPLEVDWHRYPPEWCEALDFSAWQNSRGNPPEELACLLTHAHGVLLNERFPLPGRDQELRDLFVGKSALWRENYAYLDFLRPLMSRELIEQTPDAGVLLSRQVTLWLRMRFEEQTWSTYGVSRRLLSYCQLFPMLDLLEEEAALPLPDAMLGEAVFLFRMLETDVGGNHLVKNLHALLACACLFQTSGSPVVQKHVEQWWAILEARLIPEFDSQVLPDGLHFERTPMYHVWVLLDLLGCLRLLETHRPGFVRAPLVSLAGRMLEALLHLRHSSDQIPLFGDSSLPQVPQLSDILAYAAVTGLDGLSVGEAPPVRHYPEGGFTVLRAKKASLILKSGELGPRRLPAHQHGDLGSFELHADDQPLIVDSGVNEYEPSLVRDYFRSAAAHNTLWVPGEDQAEFWSAFRVAAYPDFQGATVESDPLGARVSLAYENHNHHYGHKREVFLLNQDHPFWVIQDWVTHRSPADRPCYSLLHLHPDAAFDFQSGDGIFNVGERLLIIPYGYLKLEWSDLSPWREQLNLYSDGFSRARPGRLIAMQPRTPDSSGWVLVPYQGWKPTCKRHGEAIELIFDEPGTRPVATMITWEAEGLRIGSRPPVA